MAKIIGYSERMPFEYWDSFSPRNLEPSQTLTLFTGHSADRSTTLVVRDWSARTNLFELPAGAKSAWHAWASITTVHLVVGCRPVWSMPLGTLFARYLAGPRPGLSTVYDEASEADLADRLRFAHTPALREEYGPHRMPISECLTSVSEEERSSWLRVAGEALRALQTPAYCRIPARQSYSVRVDTDERALGAMLEVMPTNVAPHALVWVDLTGFYIMDVMFDNPAAGERK